MNETTVNEGLRTYSLLQSLGAAAQMVDQRVEAALHPYGLSLSKLSVLFFLAEADEPIALGVLSRQMHCVRSNITQLVDRLEADKLVRRVPDPEDRRSVRAAITDEGRERYQLGMQALQATQQEIVSALSMTDREDLSRILGQLIERESI